MSPRPSCEDTSSGILCAFHLRDFGFKPPGPHSLGEVDPLNPGSAARSLTNGAVGLPQLTYLNIQGTN